MIDEQRQAFNFQKFSNHFRTSFKISPQDESLQVKVEDTVGFARYDLKITQHYLNDRPELNCFRDPIDIFDYISQNFERISFEGKLIRFQYFWGYTLKKTREVQITLNQVDLDQGKIANIRIDNLTKELRQKDLQISQLEQKINKKNLEFQEKLALCFDKIDQNNVFIKGYIDDQKVKIRNNHQRLQFCIEKVKQIPFIKQKLALFDKIHIKTETELQNCTKEIKEVRLIFKKPIEQQRQYERNFQQILQKSGEQVQKQMNQLRKQIQFKFEALLKYSSNEEEKQLKAENKIKVQQKKSTNIIQNNFDNHLGNSHSQYYDLKSVGELSVKLTRIGASSSWFTFVNKAPILLFQKMKFKVKINKLTNNDISVGFCTNAGLGNTQSYSSNECIYYWGKNGGEIWKMGGQKSTNHGSATNGDIIQCEINISAGNIVWWKNSLKLTQSDTPPLMKGKPVYFSIIMYYANDSIDLSL